MHLEPRSSAVLLKYTRWLHDLLTNLLCAVSNDLHVKVFRCWECSGMGSETNFDWKKTYSRFRIKLNILFDSLKKATMTPLPIDGNYYKAKLL